MIVYGIYFGYIYEGGGVSSIYKDKERAQKIIDRLAKIINYQKERIHFDAPNKSDYILTQALDGSWKSTIYEIYLIEYKVK